MQQRFSPPDGQLLRQSYNLLFVFQHGDTRTITTTWPRAFRQTRPSQVVAASVPKKEVFAKTVTVASELCDRVQVASRSTPAHHALQVVRAVSVREAGEEVAAVQAESLQHVPSVLVSETFQLWRVAVRRPLAGCVRRLEGGLVPREAHELEAFEIGGSLKRHRLAVDVGDTGWEAGQVPCPAGHNKERPQVGWAICLLFRIPIQEDF